MLFQKKIFFVKILNILFALIKVIIIILVVRRPIPFQNGLVLKTIFLGFLKSIAFSEKKKIANKNV